MALFALAQASSSLPAFCRAQCNTCIGPIERSLPSYASHCIAITNEYYDIPRFLFEPQNQNLNAMSNYLIHIPQKNGLGNLRVRQNWFLFVTKNEPLHKILKGLMSIFSEIGDITFPCSCRFTHTWIRSSGCQNNRCVLRRGWGRTE